MNPTQIVGNIKSVKARICVRDNPRREFPQLIRLALFKFDLALGSHWIFKWVSGGYLHG